jgi:ATP-dependent protease ClpP protease subunit
MEQTILQGEIGYDLNVSDFKDHDSVLINSPGGSLFEGLAMYDFVQGNGIEVGVIGVCASAATLPLIASSKRWGTPNSRYLIHNPFTLSIGDASEMQKTADDLKAEQDRALNLYVQHLNGEREELQALMDEERIIDANEALQLGLINEIRKLNQESARPEGTDIKNLFNQFKMQFDMKDDEKKQLSGISLKLDELGKTIKALFSPKNIIIQDTNGAEIDFGDSAETVEQIAVDDTATVDGSPAEGEYVLADGTVYVFAAGVLTEIKPPESTEEPNEEMEALKEENTQLVEAKADLEAQILNLTTERDSVTIERDEFKAKLDGVETNFNTVKNEFDEFKNRFSTDKPHINTPEGEKKDEVKASFNKSKLKNQKIK